MAHVQPFDADLMEDREVRDSIMIIRRQRNMKLVGAVVGMVVFAAVAGAAVYFAYGSEMNATKNLPAMPQQ